MVEGRIGNKLDLLTPMAPEASSTVVNVVRETERRRQNGEEPEFDTFEESKFMLTLYLYSVHSFRVPYPVRRCDAMNGVFRKC